MTLAFDWPDAVPQRGPIPLVRDRGMACWETHPQHAEHARRLAAVIQYGAWADVMFWEVDWLAVYRAVYGNKGTRRAGASRVV